MPESLPPEPSSAKPDGEPDAMSCRACGRQERASEGYPCAGCGTFICIICTFRGVMLCRDCVAKGVVVPPPPSV